jgi:hypothetical protein
MPVDNIPTAKAIANSGLNLLAKLSLFIDFTYSPCTVLSAQASGRNIQAYSVEFLTKCWPTSAQTVFDQAPQLLT